MADLKGKLPEHAPIDGGDNRDNLNGGGNHIV